MPFWILIFDAASGTPSTPAQHAAPPGGSVADYSSPPILVAGAVFVFEPPVKAYALYEGEEQFQGEPFDNGILVIPSATPVFLTQIAVPPGLSGLISTRARGTTPQEKRSKNRPVVPCATGLEIGRIQK
jgi:hypothetical protein